MAKDRITSADKYVDSEKGFRFFFFAVALATIAGLSLRLYLNPTRLTGWIDHALGDQGAQIGLHYQTASLSLANGSLPQLAIELRDIEANPAKDCVPEPSVRIAKLRLPVNFLALFRGHLAIGTVSAEDMKVDLDALKVRCGQQAQNPSSSVQNPGTKIGKPVPGLLPLLGTTPVGSPPAAPGALVSPRGEPWWNAEHLAAFQELIDGFEFKRVELTFENKTKKVYLDSFLLEPGKNPGTLHVETDLLIPPELTYGEQMPKLKIAGDASSTEALVVVKAAVSEGTLQAQAQLKPAPGGLLDTKLKASIESVPLSTLVPLVTKSGIVKGAFHPRFMWMSCQASIQGRFQGLFTNNRLELQGCEIEGNGARIRAESATRRPDGSWEPFNVGMTNVDLGQILEIFEWQGPDGVFSDYGRLDGKLTVMSGDDARFTGAIKGAQIRFSSRNVRADQRITQMNARVELKNGHLKGALDELAFEGGEFDGGLEVSLSRHATEGSVTAMIRHMRLSEAVQKVLVGGRLDDVAGRAVATLEGGKLKSMTGQVKLSGLAGRDVRLREATVMTELSGPGGDFTISLRSPELELNQGSAAFKAFKPLFFAHQFQSEWVSISEPSLRARLRSSAGSSSSGGEAHWEKAEGSLESGRIHLSSSGIVSRERLLDGLVTVDYPIAKKLKWKIGGRLEAPVLSEESKLIHDIGVKGGDDRALGLPTTDALESVESDSGNSVAAKTKEGLRALRERVIRGAKNILPNRVLEDSAAEPKTEPNTEPKAQLPDSAEPSAEKIAEPEK